MSEIVSHYRILEKIGSGGMGDVYLAEDSNLHRQVALKMLRPECSADPQRLKRFLREAYAASSLSHPNIAVIYEAGETDSKDHFIAMEYVDGEALDDRLARGPLVIDEIVDLGIEIAEALEEAHAKGIIHRDLKPSNVKLSSRGHAKVLDFGLAKIMLQEPEGATGGSTDVRSRPGVVLGTIPYMSPEQLLGRTVDRRSDIFALGVLLYEMATGKRPFFGRTTTEIAEQICHGEPKAIARLNYQTPDELERIIRKCMEKDPSARYQSAREVAVDLRNLRRDRSGEHRSAAVSSPRRRLAIRIAAAVVLVAALVAGWAAYRKWATRAAALPVESIAVLPFVNTDPNTEYLSDGITGSIIDSLSELPQLKVMSRNSVFRFKGRNVDPQEIGRQLKVRAVLSGRLLQSGDRLTVDAELLDVADGRQIWGKQYDRQTADAFLIQGDIAREISDELRIKLTGEQRQRLAKRYTNDPEAYALYLKGRYQSSKRTAPALHRAIELFQQAIERDPTYALAYVGLGDCYAALPDVEATNPAEWHARAKAAVEKALEIDSSVAEAHAAYGTIQSADWNLEGAAREYRRAIELNPNYATAHHWYSLNLCKSGRREEGFSEIRKAQQLDPLSPLINLTVGVEQWARGNDTEALREYQSTIDLDPKFGWAYIFLGLLQAERGECRDAIEALRKGVDLTDRSPHAVGYLGYGLGRCGDAAGARKLAAELSARRASHVALALVFSGLRERDEVFRQFELAYNDRDPQLINLAWQREYGELRSDPRFIDLAKRVGFPP